MAKSLNDMLARAGWGQEVPTIAQWLQGKKKVNEEDFHLIWQKLVNPSYDDVSFGANDLSLVVQACEHLKAPLQRTTSLFTSSWTIDLFADRHFNEFLKCYVEKILPHCQSTPSPHIDLHVLKIEKESLLLHTSLDIAYTHALLSRHDALGYPLSTNDNHAWFDVKTDELLLDGVLRFLVSINKGSDEEKFRCLQSFSQVMEHCPRYGAVLKRTFNLGQEASVVETFSCMIAYARETQKYNQLLDNMAQVDNLLTKQKLHESLHDDLVVQTTAKNRFKL